MRPWAVGAGARSRAPDVEVPRASEPTTIAQAGFQDRVCRQVVAAGRAHHCRSHGHGECFSHRSHQKNATAQAGRSRRAWGAILSAGTVRPGDKMWFVAFFEFRSYSNAIQMSGFRFGAPQSSTQQRLEGQEPGTTDSLNSLNPETFSGVFKRFVAKLSKAKSCRLKSGLAQRPLSV